MNNDSLAGVTRRQAMGTIGALALVPQVHASEAAYPTAPIRLIIPFPPGGSTDFIGRLIAERLSMQLKQPVVVENKPGAGGLIGSQQISRATPDGYTIGIGSSANMSMVPATMDKPPYDVVKDFAPVTSIVGMDVLMVTSPNVPAKNVKEFVAWAKAQPAPTFLATFGAGTSGHFAGFLFAQTAGLKFDPVHYRTVGDALAGLLSGDVHMLMSTPAVVQAQVNAGKLNALAINGAARSPSYPNVPTFQEVGYPDMQFSNWIGLVAPPNTPAALLERINAEVTSALKLPQVQEKLIAAGYRIIGNSRSEFGSTIQRDLAMWRNMVQSTGFKA